MEAEMVSVYLLFDQKMHNAQNWNRKKHQKVGVQFWL